jgi:flavin-dependent dehydrogenase
LILAFMTDSDLIPRNWDDAMRHFLDRLQTTQLTRRWLDLYAVPTTFRRYAADSYLRGTEAGDRLRTGDSAIAFDPLSSQGVLNALVTGQKAAASILGTLAGDESSTRAYSAALESDFQTYLETRLIYYRREQRWPESIFWRRRHNAQAELLNLPVQAL